MDLVEVMTPSLRVMQMQKKEKEKEVFTAERCENLEGLDEKKEEAQERFKLMTGWLGRECSRKSNLY